MDEWRGLLNFFCLLMNSHCIPGFGNIVRVPFMPTMHAGLKTKRKDEQRARSGEREGEPSCSIATRPQRRTVEQRGGIKPPD